MNPTSCPCRRPRRSPTRSRPFARPRVPAEALHTVFVVDEMDSRSARRRSRHSCAPRVTNSLERLAHAPGPRPPALDLHQVSRIMSDFNLTVLPVLDEDHSTMIGVVTVG